VKGGDYRRRLYLSKLGKRLAEKHRIVTTPAKSYTIIEEALYEKQSCHYLK
jgi:hypothetical protein